MKVIIKTMGLFLPKKMFGMVHQSSVSFLLYSVLKFEFKLYIHMRPLGSLFLIVYIFQEISLIYEIHVQRVIHGTLFYVLSISESSDVSSVFTNIFVSSLFCFPVVS